MRRLTTRRLTGVVSAVLCVVSFCRVTVLYLEAVSAVRAERAADFELLEACSNGIARGSAKMRDACLKAQADRAAPVAFKAVVRAVHVTWREFVDSCSTPLRVLLAAIFAVGVLAQPSIAWARLLSGSRRHNATACNDFSSDDEDGENSHYIVLSGVSPSQPGFRRRVQAMMPRLLNKSASADVINNARVRELEAQRCDVSPRWETVPLNNKAHKE